MIFSKHIKRSAQPLLIMLFVVLTCALPTHALAAGDPNQPTVSNVRLSSSSVAAGSSLRVTYDVEDEDGVRSVTPIVERMRGSDDPANVSYARMFFSATGDTTNGFDMPFSKGFNPCRCRVIGLEVTDGLGWVTDVYDAAYAREAGLTAPTFEASQLEFDIAEAAFDANPPTVASVSLSSRSVMLGGNLHVSWSATDPDGVRSVAPILQEVTEDGGADHGTSNGIRFGATANTLDGCDIPFNGAVDLGKYQVIGLEVTDLIGNKTDVYDAGYAEKNGMACTTFPASDLVFEVTGSSSDPNPPSVSNVSISSKRAPVGKMLRVTFDVDDPDGVKTVDPVLCAPGFIENPHESVASSSVRASYRNGCAGSHIDIDFPTSRFMGGLRDQGPEDPR